jgi:hypothetical protein
MTEEHWEKLTEVAGQGQADVLRGLLEAQGIPVWESQEGAGQVFAAVVGRLGRVEILVPTSYLEQAQQVLDEMDEGVFEDEELEVDEEEIDSMADDTFEDEDLEDDDLDDDFDDDDFDEDLVDDEDED